MQTFSDPQAFEAMTIAEKNRIVDELKLPGTYVTALGGHPSLPTCPILQIQVVSAEYTKFSEITDAELVAESLLSNAYAGVSNKGCPFGFGQFLKLDLGSFSSKAPALSRKPRWQR